MGKYLCACLIAVFATAPAAANPYLNPVPDQSLEKMRGGFVLPTGLNVGIGITTETRIDGQLVLRSVFTADHGPGTLAIQGRDAAGNLVNLPVEPGGQAVGPDGTIKLVANGDSTRLTLNGKGTDVSHLLGNGYGSIVTNSVDGRTIDVATTIDLDLRSAMPSNLGSSLFRVETLSLDATQSLTR